MYGSREDIRGSWYRTLRRFPLLPYCLQGMRFPCHPCHKSGDDFWGQETVLSSLPIVSTVVVPARACPSKYSSIYFVLDNSLR